jgi:hypothetical protein
MSDDSDIPLEELCALIEQAAAYRLGRPRCQCPTDLGRRLADARANLAARQLVWRLRRIDETAVWFRNESADPCQSALRRTLEQLLAAAKTTEDPGKLDRYAQTIEKIVPGLIWRREPGGA